MSPTYIIWTKAPKEATTDSRSLRGGSSGWSPLVSALTSAPRLTLGQGGNQKGIEKGVWIWFTKLVSNDWSKVNAVEFPSINSQPWEVGCILLHSTSRKPNSKEGCSTGIQYHCQPSSMPPTLSDGPHCTLTTFLSLLALVYLKLLS